MLATIARHWNVPDVSQIAFSVFSTISTGAGFTCGSIIPIKLGALGEHENVLIRTGGTTYVPLRLWIRLAPNYVRGYKPAIRLSCNHDPLRYKSKSRASPEVAIANVPKKNAIIGEHPPYLTENLYRMVNIKLHGRLTPERTPPPAALCTKTP
jgi:hypothetical protein